MAINFAVAKSGNLEWHYKDPDLTEQEAMIIAVASLSQGLNAIAKSLEAVASATSEVAAEIRIHSESQPDK